MSEIQGKSPRNNEAIVADFMEAVDILEGDDKFKDLNLMDGDIHSPNFHKNKAKRNLITERTRDLLAEMYSRDSVDQMRITAFAEDANTFLTTVGMRQLSDLYLFARGGDKLMTATKFAAMFEKLKAQFEKRFEGKVYDGKVLGKQVEETRKKLRRSSGMSLDAATLRRLGYSQADMGKLNETPYEGAWRIDRQPRDRDVDAA